jgi:iron complex transport system substrate-binding protein
MTSRMAAQSDASALGTMVKRRHWVFAVTLMLLAVCGCGKKPRADLTDSTGMTLTDLAGRSVTLEHSAATLCAIGPGALRLVAYAGAADKVVGIEALEKQWKVGRPYLLAHPELLKLPVIGQGGPGAVPDPEALLTRKPDVIFASYLTDGTQADELQKKTGIPVLVLSYGPLGTFDEDELFRSVALVGQVTGNEARAGQVVEFIRKCRKDLDRRARAVGKDGGPTVYVGGLGMRGAHGIESTQARFPPLVAIHAHNVVDQTGRTGSFMIDKEQLVEWDPDIIFVDEMGWSKIRADYAENTGLYASLKAVKAGKLYGYLPYNAYATNVATAIADAYFMGTVVNPGAFKDVDPITRAREIYRSLLGKDVYEHMARDFGGFKRLELGGS